MEGLHPWLKQSIRDLDHCLGDAAAYKHLDYGLKDLYRCSESMEKLLKAFDYVVVGGRRIPPWVEARVKHLVADAKAFETEFDIRELGNYIFGCLVLRLNDDTRMYSKATYNGWGFDPRIGGQCGHYEMMVLRWMSFQVELLKTDAVDQNKSRNFLDPSALTSHFDELVENKMKLRDVARVVDTTKQDKLIFNTIVKIAKARERLSLALANGCFSCVPEAIEEASTSFDNLLNKLPANYDMTLKQWLELRLLPKLRER